MKTTIILTVLLLAVLAVGVVFAATPKSADTAPNQSLGTIRN
jgi:LPS O-antigen subunit length determinant protein (WzzB/FepE family)